jgi:predicted GIY-YIG superfamily endonuclease
MWSDWKQFPDPRMGHYLNAPFGPGVYELQNRRTGDFILIGQSKNVAWRMTSLLPSQKKEYVRDHLQDIVYRTIPCGTKEEALRQENRLRGEHKYIFKR